MLQKSYPREKSRRHFENQPEHCHNVASALSRRRGEKSRRHSMNYRTFCWLETLKTQKVENVTENVDTFTLSRKHKRCSKAWEIEITQTCGGVLSRIRPRVKSYPPHKFQQNTLFVKRLMCEGMSPRGALQTSLRPHGIADSRGDGCKNGVWFFDCAMLPNVEKRRLDSVNITRKPRV